MRLGDIIHQRTVASSMSFGFPGYRRQCIIWFHSCVYVIIMQYFVIFDWTFLGNKLQLRSHPRQQRLIKYQCGMEASDWWSKELCYLGWCDKGSSMADSRLAPSHPATERCCYKVMASLRGCGPSHVIWCRWIWWLLNQVLACHLFSAKPLPEPVLAYCQLNPTGVSEWLSLMVFFGQQTSVSI